MGTSAEMSSDAFISRVMNISGIFANIIASIIAILVLFVLQVYLPSRKKTLLAYGKLHSLMGKTKIFLLGHVNFKLFLLIFALANLLLVLFTLMLYPYQGVL